MNETVLLKILLPLIGAFVGYFIKHVLDKQKEALSKISEERRALYQQFVDMVIDLMKATKTEKKMPEQKLRNTLFEFYKKYIVYASPGVINAYSDYFQYLYRNAEGMKDGDVFEHFKKLTRILIAMRRDLGLSNRKLGKNGIKLMRALITDFDKHVK
jgi:hypothetical protein